MPDDAPGHPSGHQGAAAGGSIGKAAPQHTQRPPPPELLVAPRMSAAEESAAANRAKGLVKVSMNFSPQTIELLRELSRKSGTTVTEVVRRSIGLQKFVAAEIEAGGKLLIEDAAGKMKQVLLP